jgi:hypothetical protein
MAAIEAILQACASVIQATVDAIAFMFQPIRPFIMAVGTRFIRTVIQAMLDAIPFAVKMVLDGLARISGQHWAGEEATKYDEQGHGLLFHVVHSCVFLGKNGDCYCV